MDFRVGSDIVSVKRIKNAYQKFGIRFAERILTERELKEFEKRKDKLIFLASRFAAKEAVYKANEISPFSWHRIEILKKDKIPAVYIDGIEKKEIKLSLSHEKEFAIAFCVVIN